MIIIVFDLNFYKNKRNWIFFEIRTKYLIKNNTEIISTDIRICHRKNQLPVPEKRMVNIFLFSSVFKEKKRKNILSF